MAIRNFWSLEPGEAIFAEELNKRYKDKVEIYFPVKDIGIDLLAIKRGTNNIVTFQVKESRYYESKRGRGGSAWHQEAKKKIDRNKEKIDFYVFLIYLPGHLAKTKKKNEFEKYFIIVPTKDLLEKIKNKRPNRSGKLNFYFRLESNNQKVVEVRERKAVRQNNELAFDYSKYLNAWKLIAEALSI